MCEVIRRTCLIQILTLFAAVLLLTACNLSITPVVPVQINLKPTQTPTLHPTQTPTLQPTFTLAPPTVDPIFFRDEFDGKLEPDWVWTHEVPKQWSLTSVPGSLRIDAGRGYVYSQNIANMLLRPAPIGDFQIETKLTFLPQDNFQFAGLIIYKNEANFLQAGHTHCHSGVCVRNGLYMNHYQNGLVVFPNFGQPYQGSNVVILRLIRRGTNYIFEMSADGWIFFTVGSHASDMKPLQVGLVAGQSVEGEIIPALFDYFEITSPQ
jgi:beta-xylosidase